MARPPVFLIRNATEDDSKGVKNLASILNTVNLPNDKTVLKKILKRIPVPVVPLRERSNARVNA